MAEDRDAQLKSTLRLTAQFLAAQGCVDAAEAVSDALARLEWPSPLEWELQDIEHAAWKITSVNSRDGYASIERINA